MDARDALRAIGKHWVLFVVTALVGLAAGAALIVVSTAKYESSVTFFVSTPASDDQAALAADQFATRRVNSYVRVATSDALAKAVIAQTKVPISSDDLKKEITASADLNTVLLTIDVVDRNKQHSLSIASSIATQFPTLIGTIDTSGAKSQRVRMTVVSGPALSPDLVQPSRALTLALGLLGGLVLGAILAVLRDIFDTSVRGREALAELVERPVLGVIDQDSAAAKGQMLVVGSQARSLRAEAFRQLRTSLQFMNVDHPVKVVVVTSSVADEGKSSTAANLALVSAESGRSTLLIEGDMRRPRVAEYLGLESSVGLSNVLAGQAEIEHVLQTWGDTSLTVLASGAVPPHPSEMLGSNRMRELIKRLRERFDLVLIDSPPLLPVTDAAVTAVHADGVLLVVRDRSTSRNQVVKSLELLKTVDAPVIGTVLTMAKSSRSNNKNRYYYEEASRR